MFICETKRKRGFVSTVCKNLGWGDRWEVVNPIGNSDGLLFGWGKDITIHQIIITDFSMEVELESPETEGRVWAVFLYTSNKENVRKEQ